MRHALPAVCCLLLLTGCPSKEEVLQAAEEKGQLVAEKKARMVKGVGEGLQGEGEEAGEALLKGAAGVLKGTLRGAKTGFVDLPITVADPLAEAGLKAERAALHSADREPDAEPPPPAVKVYLILDQPLERELTLIARDADGKEVGRSGLKVAEEKTGKNFVFEFDPLVDLDLARSLELQ